MNTLLYKILQIGNCIYRSFHRLLGIKFAVGNLTIVADGIKSVTVKTGFDPKEVWILPLHREGVPVCHADVDWFSWELVPGGFVLFVKLSSSYRTVEWIARG